MARFFPVFLMAMALIKSAEQRWPDGQTCCQVVLLTGNDEKFRQEHPGAFGIYFAFSGRPGYGAQLGAYNLLWEPLNASTTLSLEKYRREGPYESYTVMHNSGERCPEDETKWTDSRNGREINVAFICHERNVKHPLIDGPHSEK